MGWHTGGWWRTLADNATGIAGATIGKRVVTSTLAIDFIKGAPVGTTISATSHITHADDRLVTIKIDRARYGQRHAGGEGHGCDDRGRYFSWYSCQVVKG